MLPHRESNSEITQASRLYNRSTYRDLLILDDLGLYRLTAQQSADLYELITSRHRVSSFVITSNRAVEEWPSLFDDPILGNSALDRLANASFQIVIEGASYREKLSPHRKLLSDKGGDRPAKSNLVLLKLPRAQGGLMTVINLGLMTQSNDTGDITVCGPWQRLRRQ